MIKRFLLDVGVLTNTLAGGEAHVFAGTVEEGQAGFGARRHGYLLLDLGVHAHLTVRIRAYFLQLQQQIFVSGQIHGAQHCEGTKSTLFRIFQK